MYLDTIQFQNFRLIRDATLKVSRDTTLIVGRNNSAKTSCMELMNMVLTTSGDKQGSGIDKKPSFDDYPLKLRPKLYANVLNYLQGKISFLQLEESFEPPSLTFKVGYGDENEDSPLGHLSHFIVDLNPDIDYVVITAAYTFTFSPKEFLTAFDNYRKLYDIQTSDKAENSTQHETNITQETFANENAEDNYEDYSPFYDGVSDYSEDIIRLDLEPKLRTLSKVKWKRADLQNVLREHWKDWLQLNVWAISPETNPEVFPDENLNMEVSIYKLRQLFPFYSIAAERTLGEDDDRYRNTLGEIVNYYFNLQDEDNSQYSKEMQDLRRQIAIINRSLETQSAKQLEILLNKTYPLGRLTDNPLYLSVSTKLNLSEEISRHTDLLYRENTSASHEPNAQCQRLQGSTCSYPLRNEEHNSTVPTNVNHNNRADPVPLSEHARSADIINDFDTDSFKDDCDFKELLPNTHNGLGYKNLIKMEFQLTAFVNALKGTAQCLPILFIEEPESHMHPQLQETFVRALQRFISEQLDGRRVHIFISTHSPHIANSLSFSDLRYACRSSDNIEYQEVSAFMQVWQARHQHHNLSHDSSLKTIERHKDTHGITNCRSDAAFSQGTGNTAVELNSQNKALQLFIHKYLSLTQCDLYFADKLILVEGETEKILLPEMIKEICGPHMQPHYYSILVIGGAYAHKLIPLIDYLRIRTLILTDLDCFYDARFDKALHKNSPLTGPTLHQYGSNRQQDNALENEHFSDTNSSEKLSCVNHHRKLEEKPIAECNVCTNTTLKYWLTEMLTPARPVKNEADTYCELFDAKGEDRLTAEDKTVGLIHLEYQTKEDTGKRGRSFEEALYCAQNPSHPLFKNAKKQSVSFRGNKINFALSLLDAQTTLQLNRGDENGSKTVEENTHSATTAPTSDSVPISVTTGLSYTVPRYIREGLSWLFEIPVTQHSHESGTFSSRLYASQLGDSHHSKE